MLKDRAASKPTDRTDIKQLKLRCLTIIKIENINLNQNSIWDYLLKND